MTVTIATSLALLMVALVVGGTGVGLLVWAADPPEAAVAALGLCVLAGAIWIGGSYLWRNRRPSAPG